MTDVLEIDFTADLPSFERKGGAGKPPTLWEDMLAPARDHPGRPGKIATFTDITKDTGKVVTGQAQAMSRATVINTRLHKAVPLEEWKFNTRKLADGSVGLWVTFKRTMTQEEFEDAEKLRLARAEKIKAGKEAKAVASDGPTPADVGVADTAVDTAAAVPGVVSEDAVAKVKAAREAKAVATS